MNDKSKILDNIRQIEALLAETKTLLEDHGAVAFDAPYTTPKDPGPHPH